MERPQFNFLIANDSKLLRDEIQNIQKQFQADSEKWRRKVFWGDELEPDAFWNSLRQQNLFSEASLVILRHANDLNAAFWKTLSSVLASPSRDVWPVICIEVDYEKNRFKVPAHIQKSRCFQYAAKKGWLREIPPLSGLKLRKYVEKIMKSVNLELNRNTLEAFCETVEPDAAAIENEALKFSLLQASGLAPEELLANQSSWLESGIFTSLGSIEKGDLSAITAQTSEIDKSAFIFPLLALLARELRLLWQLEHNEAPPIRPAEAQFKKDLARRLGSEAIAEGFALLADCEYQIKSGRQTPEQTLDFLVARAISLFAPEKLAYPEPNTLQAPPVKQ